MIFADRHMTICIFAAVTVWCMCLSQALGRDHVSAETLSYDTSQAVSVGKDADVSEFWAELLGCIAEKPGAMFPDWIKIPLEICLILLALFIVFVIILKGQIKRVTEQINKKSRQLIESETQYRTLFESTPDGVIVSDADGRIVSANPAAAAIMGYENPEELIGKAGIDFYYNPEDRKKMLSQLMAKDELKDYQLTIRQFSGKPRDLLCSLKLIRDENGAVSRINGILRDITEKKALEAQLMQAQKMEAVGTLASGIAHNFNNLLMGIKGRASILLSEENLPAMTRELLEGIEACVDDASDMTKQLLGYGREGKFEVRPVDINKIAADQVRMFGQVRKEIVISEKYADNLWSVKADPNQIKQVLMNLFVNAWQAMPEAGRLCVSTSNVNVDETYVKVFSTRPGNYVKISVADNGTGMDRATRQRIFDPFFTTKKKETGTGLGLASAYGIIKNHGGFINVYSELGKGSVFNIYLPAAGEKVSKRPEQAHEKISSGKGHILLVDDEEMILDVGSRMLKKLGYQVTTVNNGRLALELYQAKWQSFDLVILDMIMPDMGGAKLYEKLKKVNPDIKALLSSGYSVNDQTSQILEQGCNGFIQKPFGLKELSMKLGSLEF